MPWPVHPNGLLAAGTSGDNDTYQISRSLRFNSADSAYLSSTPASAGNRKTWTWSGWVKKTDIGGDKILFNQGGTSSNYVLARFTSDNLEFHGYSASAYMFRKITNAVFRDTTAWYHIVFVMDATNTTAKIYVNGIEQSYSTNTNPSNTDQNFNLASEINIGRATSITQYLNGYLTEINFIDGQALTPSSFGETDAITGRWKAKAYSGTYGTNGFYLKFADNSGTTATTLGKDSSGNGNNWTPNNFSVTAGTGNDSLVDSPTNYGTDSYSTSVDNARGNYCTLNPLMRTSATISDGNLKVSNQTANRVAPAIGTMYADISATSGKYIEVTIDTVGAGSIIGIIRSDIQAYESSPSTTSGVIGLASTGELYSNGSFVASFTTYTTNDILGLYFSSGNLYYAKNGTVMNSGSPVLTGLTGYWTFYTTNGGSVGSLGCTVNFGQRPFAYTAPSGFKALCTTNITTPTIKKPSTAMDVVTYTGTGASQSISSLGFSPDLVWIKGRSGATDHTLYDVIRGSQARIESNTTDAEVTSDNGLTSFDSAGFTIGTLAQINTNTATYVGWSWDAGSSNSTNNSGSITSTVRANPQAGFSIVSYTGNNTSGQTVGHGLGTTPAMIIIKNRPAGSNAWVIWHKSLASTELLTFTTTAKISDSNSWDGGSFTSTTFKVGNSSANYDTNFTTGGGQHIAYCFAEIEGYSRFGSYTGNGSSDGPFVWCGFRPRWVMIKRSDASSTYSNWYMCDSARNTYNVGLNFLNADTSKAENIYIDNSGGGFPIDFLSNGFKYRANNSGGDVNASGGTYIFAAFAEAPFKYARAR